MKKRSLKIMSVVLAGVMTTGMILGGCSAGGDKENGGSERSVAKISRSRYGGKSNRYETHYCKNADRAVVLCKQSGSISKRFLGICSWR